MPTIEEYKEVTLNQLFEEGLSIRAVHCCESLLLNSLYDIIIHFIKTQDFINVKCSGIKTASELNDLCISKYSELDNETKEHLLISTIGQNALEKNDFLFWKNKVCEEFFEQRNIKSPGHFIKYMVTHNFLKEENKTNIIKCILKLYGDLYNKEQQNQENNPQETSDIHKLNAEPSPIYALCPDKEKFTYLKNYFQKEISKASARIQHVFCTYDVQDFLKLDTYSFLSFENIGKGCIHELKRIQEKLKLYAEKLITSTDAELQYLHVIDTYDIDNNFVLEFYESNGRLPMFWIIEQYYQTHIKERSLNIYATRFPIKKNFTYDEAFLEKIGSNYGIVRERARQIAVHVFDDLKSFPIIHQDWEWYKEALLDKQHFAGSDILKGVLEHENSSFSCEFALQILCWVYENQYDYVGHSIKEWKKKDYWNLKLIVEKKIVQSFDFDFFYFEYKKKKEKFGKDTWCNIDEICMPYMKTQDWEIRATISKIVGYIFASDTDFDLTVVGNKVMFPAEREQKPNDIIYDILQEAKRPMHITEIFDRFKELYPDHKYDNFNQLRSWFQRDDRFSYQSRKSTYLLKEWVDIYSGTKGDAAIEFLKNCAEPQPIEAVLSYVNQCFPDDPSTFNSLSTLMRSDAKKRFEKYNGGLYGLKRRDYGHEYMKKETTSNKTYTVDERLEQLNDFVLKNKKLPKYNVNHSEEFSLKRWMVNIEKGKIAITDVQKAHYFLIKNQILS